MAYLEKRLVLVLEPGDELSQKFDGIAQMCDAILTKMEVIMSAFTDLKAASEAEEQSILQVSAYLQELISKLNNATTPEEISAITAEITAHKAQLDGVLPTPATTTTEPPATTTMPPTTTTQPPATTTTTPPPPGQPDPSQQPGG